MKLMLDTNTYSALMKNDQAVVNIVRCVEKIFLSDIVIGELLYGFRNGNRFSQNHQQLNSFLANPFVQELVVERDTADRYSRILIALRKKGKPIPSNDLWIAAHAMQKGCELLSYDKHFSHVDGLAWLHPG
ncbi:type II toxin-antitoxin system VapC family toxin [Candidatus Venteria ishoeyi]|uniref:Ribonuclease VapC n=1 Tax=Candidatus Venteria ishoeyi TaxID=1899563 RepID=A0A1H6FIY1_9GAMM|nr:type II toxin-antitoxin system VapC family toxin [Candidatus Venteria ishoeyi]MDM8545683.1 type II toxin-antitoxin system VapC family toxin [Candidatus Venteria ishoeyi]SEH09066.1 Ribonuclease VapC1 [Candidatus Venteria ishoeyi]